MALLTAEADKLSLPDFIAERAAIQGIVTVDEVFARLPFVAFNGKTFDYKRELTLPAAAFEAVDATVTESTGTVTEVSARMKTIVGDARIDNMLQLMESDTVNQTSHQVMLKAKQAGRTYSNAFINGDEGTNPEEFDGLIEVLTDAQFSAQSFAVTGALSFDAMDQLIDLVKVGSNLSFIMPSRTIRAYYALARAMPGGLIENLTLPGITGPVPSYRGIPILKNEWIPITQGGGADTSIFLAAMDENEGVHGLMPTTNAGINIVDVGESETRNAKIWRVVWYASLAVESVLSLASATGITN